MLKMQKSSQIMARSAPKLLLLLEEEGHQDIKTSRHQDIKTSRHQE